MGRKAARGPTKLAADLGRPEATKAIRTLLTPERQLSEAAFLFTNLWLGRLLENQSRPAKARRDAVEKAF